MGVIGRVSGRELASTHWVNAATLDSQPSHTHVTVSNRHPRGADPHMAIGLKAIESRLWKVSGTPRANSGLKASGYSTTVLGLIFLKYAGTLRLR